VAEVDTSSEPRSLRGSISVDGCASCPSTAFHAVRVPRTALEGVR
jgi:hypothetical protein